MTKELVSEGKDTIVDAYYTNWENCPCRLDEYRCEARGDQSCNYYECPFVFWAKAFKLGKE